METSSNHDAVQSHGTPRMFMGILCVAMVVASSGCAGCFGELRDPTQPGTTTSPSTSEPLPTNACSSGGCTAPKAVIASITELDCPTGNCDPGNLNGKGIYTVEGGNYCFFNFGDGRFCPESLVNDKTDGVVLEVRDRNSPLSFQRRTIKARYKATPNSAAQDATLLSIRGDKSQFSLRYSVAGNEATATGNDLTKFTFSVHGLETAHGDASPLAGYEFTITPVGLFKGLTQYAIQYLDLSTNEQRWHCQGDGMVRKADSLVTFLPQERVSGVSGLAQPETNVLTMACQTGAIVTCMSWGYTPWNDKGELDNDRNHVFRSCLQAKRAAYFVGRGDLTSYTKTGTEIYLRDQYGVGLNQGDVVPHLEALWSPTGAVCVNPDSLRHLKNQPTVTQQAGKFGIPTCTRPPAWNDQGKLATGPKVLAP
ncbi:ADYC domain-containing protein [Archangium sp.]|uniref:ADYC domain-containing protein n=1 Tax=Archangium sp. TaxID=1872627 RepID=UPI00389990D9